MAQITRLLVGAKTRGETNSKGPDREIQTLRYVLKAPKGYSPEIFPSTKAMELTLASKILVNQTNRVLTGSEIEILCLGLDYIPTLDAPTTHMVGVKELRAFGDQINRVLIQRHVQSEHDRTHTIRLQARPAPNFSNARARSAFNKARAILIRKGHYQRIRALGVREVKRRGIMSRLPKPKEPRTNPQTWETIPEVRHLLAGLSKSLYGRMTASSMGADLKAAIVSLYKDDSVYITSADKGGGTIIWGVEDYRREAARQLEDRSTYREIDKADLDSQLTQLNLDIGKIIAKLLRRKHITTWEGRGMATPGAGPSAFYLLPKIHKPINIVSKTFSGRPIVATHSAPTHFIDKFLTELTKPLLRRIPGSLLDTLDLLNQLPPGKVPAGTRVVTADVNSLYPSIPWAEGIEAAVDFYRENLLWLSGLHQERGLLGPPTAGTFGELLRLVLENSLIHFQGSRWFHQVKGTAMGCCISVYFANTYMLAVTRQVIESPPPHVLLFSRFIDDILLLTTGTDEQIQTLFDTITNKHIAYDVSRAQTSGSFLDLLILVVEHRVETRPYSKPTSVPFFLHASSNHPYHLVHSIPYAQLVRLKRNASRETDYRKHAKALIKSFRLRGYPEYVLQSAKKKCNRLKRSELLKRGKTRSTPSTFTCLHPYSRGLAWGEIQKTISRISTLIQQHYAGTDLGQAICEYRSTLVATTGRTIGSFFSGKLKNPKGPRPQDSQPY